MWFYSIVILICLRTSLSWNFEDLNLDDDQIELSRIALYFSKAYIAIPRVYEEQSVTLVEVPWPESSAISSTPRAYPSIESQKLGDCNTLQSAISLSVDSLRGYLYVLDQGYPDQQCSPKIIAYHLITGREVQKELLNVPIDNLSSIVTTTDLISGSTKIIVGDAGNTSLVLYDFKEYAWWRIMLHKNFLTEGDFMLINKKHIKTDKTSFAFDQLAIAKKSSILFATSSESKELFSVDLNEIKDFEGLKYDSDQYDNNQTSIKYKYVGDKFGKSSGLYINSRNDLYYFYKRDYAILKWNIDDPYSEEYVEIMYQNPSMAPHVVQIFSDSGQLWVLNSKRNSEGLFTVKINK